MPSIPAAPGFGHFAKFLDPGPAGPECFAKVHGAGRPGFRHFAK